MEKIPTAEEFATEHDSFRMPRGVSYQKEIGEMLIEFAKLHVRLALKKASEEAEAIEGWNTGFSGSAATVDQDSILNAYPDENIK